MQFFKHDTGMIHDPKIQLLLLDCGGIAYAVYNATLELIAGEIDGNNSKCEILNSDKILAHELCMNIDEVRKILSKCLELKLIEGSIDGSISCKKILSRLNAADVSNPALRKAISKIKIKSDKRELDTNQGSDERELDTNQEIIKADIDIDIDIDKEIEKDKEKDKENLNIYITDSDSLPSDRPESEKLPFPDIPSPMTQFEQEVFSLLQKNNLPCCRGNFITFIQKDFYFAIQNIRALHLHSDEVIAATKNYCEVINLAREGKSWFTSEMTFFNFCKDRGPGKPATIISFLPDNFSLDYFLRKKPEDKPGGLPDDRIRL